MGGGYEFDTVGGSEIDWGGMKLIGRPMKWMGGGL